MEELVNVRPLVCEVLNSIPGDITSLFQPLSFMDGERGVK